MGEPPPVFPGLGTEDIIAAARSDSADVEELCRQRATERLASERNPLGLIGPRDTAALLGLTENVVRLRMRKDADFPRVVLTLQNEDFLSLRDVRAYSQGKRRPRYPEGKYAGQVLSSREVAERLDIGLVLLRHRVVNEEWDRVPPPTGRANQKHYWKLDQLQKWEDANPPESRPRFRHQRRSADAGAE